VGMKKYWLFVVLIILFFNFQACKTGNEEPLKKRTLILGHRGSGTSQQSDFQENTYESVHNAFEKLDGAEVDIQCSKDGTLWLFHDANLPENHQNLLCIPQSSDYEIRNLETENVSFTVTPLEEILLLMSEMEKTSYLSLDVKGYFNNGCFETTEQLNEYFKKMASGLSDLLSDYPLYDQIMVETDYQYFLDLINEHEIGVSTYLLGYNDFKQRMHIALDKSYDGISFNHKDESLTEDDILNAGKENLKIQLWTVNNEDDFKKIIGWSPDFIQTGNVELGEKFIHNSNMH
jgi:glycerophosphoryl diester phosphodiesterase